MSNKTIRIYNPINFEPDNILPEKWKKHTLLIRLFVSILLNKTKKEDEFTPLKMIYLRKNIHDRLAEQIKNILIDAKVIECDNVFSPGNKCYGYRLTPKYRNQQVIPFIIDKKTDESSLLNCSHKAIWKWLNKTEIDYPPAVVLLKNSNAKEKSLKWLSLERLRLKDYFFSSDGRGRVYHNVACMWSEFRPYLSINGEKLVNIDIANSQPLIFAIRLKQLYNIIFSYINDAPLIENSDLHHYIQLVEQGKLYNYLMDELNIGQENRKSFKKKFFAEVFYSRLDYESELSKQFAFLFPHVFKAICDCKQEDYRDLPLLMQKIEADLMIGDVCMQLAEHPDIPFLTIHDSFLVFPRHVDFVKNLIRDSFAMVGLVPTFKVLS